MKILITADFDAASGLDEITTDIYRAGYDKYFLEKRYGDGLLGLTVIFMCRNPALNFKRRIRFDKKKKKLYMDIMLDLEEMKSLTYEARRQVVIQRLAKEVPEIVSKYRLLDFDREQFFSDLKAWLNSLGWY